MPKQLYLNKMALVVLVDVNRRKTNNNNQKQNKTEEIEQRSSVASGSFQVVMGYQ